MNMDVEPGARARVSLTLTVPDAPDTGFTVVGAGFDPDSWIWVTIQDLTDGTQPINGPDAFQSDPDGTFTRTGQTVLTCGHTVQSNAYVDNEIVATSDAVTPQCEPVPADTTTADVDATPATNALYADLVAAPTRVDHRLIIGQALRGWDAGNLVGPVKELTDLGLPAPKLLEVDVTDFELHADGIFTLLLDHAAQGGLIGLSYHVGNPFTGGGVNDRSQVDLPQLADPDNPQTPAGTRWKADLDRVADIVQQLADVGATVLFRPLHESNGHWFWWGQSDPADFRATWQGMFRYLTATRGLHNLLWVYSASRDYGDALSDPIRLYPGDDVVDIVGLDIYDDDLSDAEPGKRGYAAMAALGKPFGIAEYAAQNAYDDDAGHHHPAHDGDVFLPNDRVIGLIKERYPRTVLATAWYSSFDERVNNHWQISDKRNPQALLLDTWAITR
ncbi:MAG: mannan endo,4-beta-mannosidase [Frankiaceae bacterium]|nr:mannan endo,4-beta-mannosidase [Frankiaceae bacterium]